MKHSIYLVLSIILIGCSAQKEVSNTDNETQSKDNTVTVNDGENVSRSSEGSSAKIVFEGEGNEVIINNENVESTSKNDTTTIVIKGDNNKIVIDNKNVESHTEGTNSYAEITGSNQDIKIENYDIKNLGIDTLNSFLVYDYEHKLMYNDLDFSDKKYFDFFTTRFITYGNDFDILPKVFVYKYINHLISIPDSEEKYYNLATSYKRLGEKEKMIRTYQIGFFEKEIEGVGYYYEAETDDKCENYRIWIKLHEDFNNDIIGYEEMKRYYESECI